MTHAAAPAFVLLTGGCADGPIPAMPCIVRCAGCAILACGDTTISEPAAMAAAGGLSDVRATPATLR